MIPLVAGFVAFVAAIVCWTESSRAGALRELVGTLSGGYQDDESGLYSLMAIAGRLVPDLQWASLSGQDAALVLVRWHAAARFEHEAASEFARNLRGYECAYRIGPGEILIAFSGVTPLGLVHAVRRLLERVVERVGPASGDVGAALFPLDAVDVDDLVDCARARSRPWQDWIAVAERYPWVGA